MDEGREGKIADNFSKSLGLDMDIWSSKEGVVAQTGVKACPNRNLEQPEGVCVGFWSKEARLISPKGKAKKGNEVVRGLVLELKGKVPLRSVPLPSMIQGCRVRVVGSDG